MGDGQKTAAHGTRRGLFLEPGKRLGQRLAEPLVVGVLVVGILLGLLLGWVVWPVQWYDTDPSDLRLQHQVDYVILASDSLAVTGDVAAASQRLAELTDDDTTWHQVANLVEKVAAEREADGDLASALRLRRMAQAAGLPLATSTEFSPRSGADGPSALPYVLAAVALVGIGVAGYLYRMRFAQAQAAPRPSTPATWLSRAAPATAMAVPPARSSTLDLQGEEDDDLLDDDDLLVDEDDDAFVQGDDLEDEWDDETVPETPVVEPPRDEGDLPAIPRPPAGVRPGNGDAFLGGGGDGDEDAAADDEEVDDWGDEDEVVDDLAADDEAPTDETPAGVVPAQKVAAPERLERGARAQVVEALDVPPDALGLFEAEYILGDDDFDASFTIESPDGEFLGECGVGLTDVLDVESGVQRADAFEVWLFDKGDIRTVTKVLVSEQAYRDEARSARLAAKGDLVIAQPGLEVTLETLSLRVTVTLRDCEFAEGSDGPEGYFVRLDLELLAESSDAVP